MEKERMILGEGCFYSMDCNETGLNNNIIVCGGSGSGKTMSISEPRLLETKTSSLVATVTKRRIVKKYKPLFKERGYEILDLNYVNPLESNYFLSQRFCRSNATGIGQKTGLHDGK